MSANVVDTFVQAPTVADVEDANLKTYNLVRLPQVPAPPEREWIVKDVLGKGSLSFLCGKPGVGKSSLSKILMAVHTDSGAWLGFDVVKTSGLIVWLGFEEDAFSMREPFRRMGLTDTQTRHIAVIDRTSTGGWSPSNLVQALKRLEKMIQALRPSLLVIDPLLNLTRPKDSNQYEAVKEALDPVLHIARATGTHILCLVHAKKGDYNDIEAVLGSIGFAATPDKIMLHMRRGKRSFLSNPKTRDTWGVSFNELELVFDPLKYTVTVGTEQHNTQTKTEERILAAFGTGQRKRLDVFVQVKGGKELFNKAFARLEDAGLLEEVKRGIYVVRETGDSGRRTIIRNELSPSKPDENTTTDNEGALVRDGRCPFVGSVPGAKASRTEIAQTPRRRIAFSPEVREQLIMAELVSLRSRSRVTYDEVVD